MFNSSSQTNRMFSTGENVGSGDTLRPGKGHVKSASVSSSGPEATTDTLRSRYVWNA